MTSQPAVPPNPDCLAVPAWPRPRMVWQPVAPKWVRYSGNFPATCARNRLGTDIICIARAKLA